MGKVFRTGFFVSWLISFIFMYGISYAWHGVLLNDLHRVPYSIELFLLFVAVVYFVISFGITLLTDQLIALHKNIFLRGAFIGALIGLFIYLIAFVFGISFYSNPSIGHILFDLSWQIIEQTCGGIVAAFVINFASKVVRV